MESYGYTKKRLKQPAQNRTECAAGIQVNQSDADYDKLLQAVTQPPRMTAKDQPNQIDIFGMFNKDIILIILHTGARRGEAVALKWTDIQGRTTMISRSVDGDLDEGMMKTRKPRKVPLSPEIMDMLTRRRFAGYALVFTTRDSKMIGPRNVLRIMKKLTDHHIHDLQHTYITRAARAGVNAKVLQTITGHKTLTVLLSTYTHVAMPTWKRQMQK